MTGKQLVQKITTPFTTFPYRKRYKQLTGFIKRRPLGSFFIALGLLLVAIIIGHIANQPKQQKAIPLQAKTVQIYSIGTAPKITVQAKVEKAGVVKIVAQSGGIVQNISVTEGKKVAKGQQLMSLSTNYQGGNAPALQAEIAQKQYQNVLDTFDKQKDAIQKQKDIANITHDNFTDQQSIATASASETNDLIDANQTILDTLNQQLTDLKNSSASQAAILAQESTINQLQGGQNQLKQALRNLQTQTESGKPAGRLTDTQRDLTIEQLELQEKSLELNKEVSGLQAQLAAVAAANMTPATPVKGVVQRIFVHVGQHVSSGTVLAVVAASSDDPETIAVADVPQQIAQHISRTEKSTVYIGDKSYQLKPYYVSIEATTGLLYSIFYTIPTTYTSMLTDGQYVAIAIPVGSANTGYAVPFVPIDAVYQTQDKNYLLLDEQGKAVSRDITLGQVFGSYIEITKGLHAGDQVILNRNIIAGDKVTTE